FLTSGSFLLHLCLCLSTRGPPPSALFPYTTLFRSDVVHNGGLAERAFHGGEGGLNAGPRPLAFEAFDQPRFFAANVRGRSAVQKDRKSTRLNSSHVKISYAVFCLKKKN